MIRVEVEGKVVGGGPDAGAGRVFIESSAQVTLEELIRLTASGEIHPEPGRVMPLAEAGAAHHLLEGRRNVGKIVLRV